MTYVTSKEADNWLRHCRNRLITAVDEDGVERLDSSDDEASTIVCDTESAEYDSAREDKNASDIIDRVLKSCEQDFNEQIDINQEPRTS
jgi:hypothetical protein